jgi:DNA-binding NarL/FixJ family response regulator
MHVSDIELVPLSDGTCKLRAAFHVGLDFGGASGPARRGRPRAHPGGVLLAPQWRCLETGKHTATESTVAQAMEAIRVVLAEDSALLRESLSRLISTNVDFDLVGVASDLPQLFAVIEDQSPDVVITDIRMPPTGTDEGIQAAEWLRERRPQVGVVILSQYASPGYALDLLKHGSAGRAYLLKERVAGADELARAVRTVAQGGSVVDPLVVDQLVKARRKGEGSDLSFLTVRESEILAEMAQGKSNAAIAGALGISERAVEKHSNSIFAKLGLSEERDVNRRVKAVLVFLSEPSGR